MKKNDKELKRILEVSYPLAFFQIQFVFAQKLSSLKDIPLDEALLIYTTFYKRIGIQDWEHDPNNKKWQQFILEVHQGQNPAELAHAIYMKRFSATDTPLAPRSCFSYSYDQEEKAVTIHFQNNFASAGSPLARENTSLRTEELRHIFQEVKEKHPEAQAVEGGSWLYAYESYKRLFPSEYIANLEESGGGFRGNGRWGQFLTSSGSLNEQRAQQFLESIEKAASEAELMAAFPFKFFKTEARISTFYVHFGLERG